MSRISNEMGKFILLLATNKQEAVEDVYNHSWPTLDIHLSESRYALRLDYKCEDFVKMFKKCKWKKGIICNIK